MCFQYCAPTLSRSVGDGGAREVEGAAVEGGDDLYGVGVGDVFWGAGDFEGGDVYMLLREGGEQGGDVLGGDQRFVALDVDVDGGVEALGDGVDAVGAAGEVGAGEFDGPVVLVAQVGDLFGVGGDYDVVELRAGAGGGVDPGEHGLAGDLAEDLARQASRGEAGGDDAKGAGGGHVGGSILRGEAGEERTSAAKAVMQQGCLGHG